MAELGWAPHAHAALAVSGGGDSLALMHLFAGWARAQNAKPPVVLIVDHGLRPESSKDAAKATRWAKRAGLEAHILHWQGRKPKADIEAQAREARYRLMGEWCRAHGVDALFVAHTREDQAETFLLRLARGSGVDGLSSMQPRAPFPAAGFASLNLFRPLLDMTRGELREYLGGRDQPWLDDPMNADPRFARTRLRTIFPILEAAGLSASRIADAARHLARAREALDASAAGLMAKAVYYDTAGYALIDAKAIANAPRELGLRALGKTLMAVSGENYRPRFERLEQLFDAMLARKISGGRTLHGCRIAPAPKPWRKFGEATLLVTREARAAMRSPDTLLKCGVDAIWDNRFRIVLTGQGSFGRLHLSALGERPELTEVLSHIPAPARGALPAIWRGKSLITVPHTRPGGTGTNDVHVAFLAAEDGAVTSY